MADLTRADELVRTMERDDAFRAEVQAAPTGEAKRGVLDAHGYHDVGLEEMRAYVESKGGTLVVPPAGRELSDQELAAVAGGTSDEAIGLAVGLGGVTLLAAAGAAAG